MAKKGVSPLIATVLLIILSIGIGLAVMSWGRAYIEEKAEFVQGVQETITLCDSAEVSVVVVEGVPQLCLEGNIIKGFVDNGPDVDVYDIQARVAGTAGVYTQESTLPEVLKRSKAAQIAFAVPTIGKIKQVKLTPKIRMNSDIVFCSQSEVVVEPILLCPGTF